METAPGSQVPTLAGSRVLYAVTKSNGGGAQNYVRMLAAGARDAGAEVAVMAGSADGKGGAQGILFEQLETAGIRAIRLGSIRRDVGLSAERSAYRELRDTIAEYRPEVLHLNSSKMGFLGALAGRSCGVPHILFTAHGWPHKEQRPLLWKTMAWLGSWLTIVLCHRVICVSETDLKNSPTLLFRDKLALVHNGVSDFPRVSPEEARAALVERAPGLAAFPQILLMNAELHPNKGVSTAIRALSELAPRRPELALAVCGEGQEKSRLVNLAGALGISDRVFLLGFVPEVRQYLPAATVYLMPSRKEGLPLALLEAGLASLPVVASKVGGIPEVITDKETGLFMPRSNTHILAEAIAYLLDHPEQAAAMGAALRKKVLADFSEDAMLRATFALYR